MVNALCYVQYIHLELWQHLPHEQYISFYVLRNLTCILLLQLFRDLLIFFCFHICYNLVTLTHCNILLFQYLFVFICFNIQIYTASFYLSPYMLIHPIYIFCVALFLVTPCLVSVGSLNFPSNWQLSHFSFAVFLVLP